MVMMFERRKVAAIMSFYMSSTPGGAHHSVHAVLYSLLLTMFGKYNLHV